MHTLNIMHALFAFIQFIHSFHSSFHYFHFHIANKSVHAHEVLYELLFRSTKRGKNLRIICDLMNIFVSKSGPHNISASFSFFFTSLSHCIIVNGLASLWINNSLKTKQNKTKSRQLLLWQHTQTLWWLQMDGNAISKRKKFNFLIAKNWYSSKSSHKNCDGLKHECSFW